MIEGSTPRPKEPWDRRRDEPEKAYSAFEIYSDLPPGQRTFKEAYRLYTGNHNAASPSDNFKGWAKRHDWEERAAALDGPKAKARFEGELSGIEKEWERIGAERERAHTQVIELAEKAYDDAVRIYEKGLTKDNYSKAHAVQMSKFVLEVYRMLTDLEKFHRDAEQEIWTEEDEDSMAKYLEALDDGRATEFFEEQDRKKREEEEKGPGKD